MTARLEALRAAREAFDATPTDDPASYDLWLAFCEAGAALSAARDEAAALDFSVETMGRSASRAQAARRTS